MFLESEYTEEQSLMAGVAGQLSKQYNDFYFLQETKKNNYPSAFWDEMSQGGYLGILVEEEFGGAGMSTPDLVVFLYNMAKEGLVSYQLINQILCSDIISRMGTDEQKNTLLPSICKGDFWCYSDLEQTRGNSLFAISSTAKKNGDSYVLNGTKRYAVCAKMASKLIIAARTSDLDKDKPEAGLSLFVVDADTAGIEYTNEHINVRITKAREEMASTGDLFNNIIFKDAKIPASALIGQEGQAADLLNNIASRQMLMVSLMTIGWGDRLVYKTADYAKERVIFKDSIASYQAVQHPLVRAKTDVEMAKLLAERAAQLFDSGLDNEVLLSYCSVAKSAASEAAYAACDSATQTHGGSGYDRDTGIVSLWPLILMSRLVPLNNNIILERFSEKVLGLPATDGTMLNDDQLQELVFEARTEREVTLINHAKEAFAKGREEGNNNAAMTLMARLMGGDLAEYKDMVMSESEGVLPIKLDILRQFAFYMGTDPTEGKGIAQTVLDTTPLKYALSAMAMAAVSSGEGGTNKVMTEYVPQMMQGKLFCYCITEPGAGTNTHNVSTIAVDEGDHFRLNGQKTFISAADTAHFMAVVARVEVDGVKESVGTFCIESKLKGISMTELDIAVLGDPQFTVHFDDVIIPKDALVGTKSTTSGKSKGISEGVFYTLNLERIIVALSAKTFGEESLAKAIKKAKQAQEFGPLAGDNAVVKQKAARLFLELELTKLALKKATVAFDNNAPGKQVGLFANMAKYVSTMFSHEAGDLALQVYGLEGLDKELDDIGGLCQLGRVIRTVPINNEMVLNFLAENILEMPKSYNV